MKACHFSVQHSFPEKNYVFYQVICYKLSQPPPELILQYHWGLCQEVIVLEPGAIAKTHIAKTVLRHFFSDHPGQVGNDDRTRRLWVVLIQR